MMPTMLPRVGPGRAPGAFYKTGHGHLGWALSAVTADAIGEVVEHALRPVAVAAYSDVPNYDIAQRQQQLCTN